MSRDRPSTFGWHRDLPDPRDFAPDNPAVQSLYRALKPVAAGKSKRVDWSEFFLPVWDQLRLNASSTHACAGLAEYFERHPVGLRPRSRGCSSTNRPGGSRKVPARVRPTSGRRSRHSRDSASPERLRPYHPERVRDEPEPFLYAYSRDYQSLNYVRLDPVGITGEEVLRNVRHHLAAGFPTAFGFSAFNSLSRNPDIPCPTRFDAVKGGRRQSSSATTTRTGFARRRVPSGSARPGAKTGVMGATAGFPTPTSRRRSLSTSGP